MKEKHASYGSDSEANFEGEKECILESDEEELSVKNELECVTRDCDIANH